MVMKGKRATEASTERVIEPYVVLKHVFARMAREEFNNAEYLLSNRSYIIDRVTFFRKSLVKSQLADCCQISKRETLLFCISA